MKIILKFIITNSFRYVTDFSRVPIAQTSGDTGDVVTVFSFPWIDGYLLWVSVYMVHQMAPLTTT